MINFLKRSRLFFAALIILAALISSLFRALTPWAIQYKAEVEQHLSVLLGGQVTVQTMETGWYWFEPVIKLKQVTLIDAAKTEVRLKQIIVGIDLFSSLWHWQLQPGILYVDGLNLTVRQINDQWQIDGLNKDETHSLSMDRSSWTPVLAWILGQQKIIVKRVAMQIYLQDGRVIPVRKLNLLIVKNGGNYRMKARVSLAQKVSTNLKLLASLDLNPYRLQDTAGQIYVAFDKFLPAQWQGFLKSADFKVLDGQSDLKAWIDLKDGRIVKAQGSIMAERLVWKSMSATRKQRLQSLKGNVSWNENKAGWQLAANDLEMTINGRYWPKNNLVIQFQQQDQRWKLYVKQLMIESLLALDIPWPATMQPLLSIKPRGFLQDTQIQIKDRAVNSLLSQFESLSWNAQENYPGINNLSGVLHWQPSSGELSIDSEKITIEPKDKPPVTFKLLNAAFDWQRQGQGFHVNMARLVLRHPDLMLRANGSVDGFSGEQNGLMVLKAEFAASNAQRWMAYVPSQHLKKKLDAWLKQDIKRINKVVGDVTVNGLAADFPFDQKPGIFEINAHLTGVDLFFHPLWPLARDIEAYLKVNKRNLNADIVYANLQGIFPEQINLRIEDIGLDHEALVLHGKVNTFAGKALDYVLSSPLNKKLSELKRLKMEGPLSLDLQLEVPLYPENDEVLALGDINFENNQVKVNQVLNNITIADLKGSLQFDQEGVLESNLNATLFHRPATIQIESFSSPNPRTEVKIKAKTSIKSLGEQLNVSLLPFMQGELGMDSLLVLGSEAGSDRFQIQSSLKDVVIDLPPPLGKVAGVKAPLKIDIELNTKKPLKLAINYDERLTANFSLTEKKGVFQLQNGNIRIGNAAPVQGPKGIYISGLFNSFDLKQWQDIWAKMPETNDQQGFAKSLRGIDLKLKQLNLAGQTLDNLHFKATRSEGDDWAININQQQVDANLHYKPAARLLSGVFNHLKVDPLKLKATAMTSAIKAKDLPNLDLQIRTFHYGEFDVGSISLKAKSSAKAWIIEDCSLQSPYYQAGLSGQWQQDQQVNSSQISMLLQITDLARSLERWHISPVVESSRGYVRFEGNWPGSFFNFSLAKLKGKMALEFKDGRITHLSPETEEKLGLGKLLSILSLQTIPRRLKLDFSDLSKAGYSFDQLKGNFDIVNGVMATTDSFIDGPVAYASMKGQLDIVRQLYDVDLSISPHITASLPIVATIAGGPVAGVATWVASKIINKGMQKIKAYTYKITGPWKNPEVKQVSFLKKQGNEQSQ